MNNQQLQVSEMSDNSPLDREDSPPPSLYPEFPTFEKPPSGTKAKNSPKIPHIIRKNVFTAPGFLEKRSNVHNICDVIRAKNAAKSDNNHDVPSKKSDEKSKIGTSNRSGNVHGLNEPENQILSTKPPKYNPTCKCSMCETYRNQNPNHQKVFNSFKPAMNAPKNMPYKPIIKNFDGSRASEPIQPYRWKQLTNLQAQKIMQLPFTRPGNRFLGKPAISQHVQAPSPHSHPQSGQGLGVQNTFSQYPTNGNLVPPNYNTPNPVYHLKTSRGIVHGMEKAENQILSTKPPKYNPKYKCSLCETYRNQNQSSMNCSKNVAYKQIMKNFDGSRASEPIQPNRWKTPTNLQAQKINQFQSSRPDNRLLGKPAISYHVQAPSPHSLPQLGQYLGVQNSFPQCKTYGNAVPPNYNTPNPVYHLKTSRGIVAVPIQTEKKSTKSPGYNPKCKCNMSETYRNRNKPAMHPPRNVAYKPIFKNFDGSRASEQIQPDHWKKSTNLQAQKNNQFSFSRPGYQSNRFLRKPATSQHVQTPSPSTYPQFGQCLGAQNTFPQYPTNGNLVPPNYNTLNPVHHFKPSLAVPINRQPRNPNPSPTPSRQTQLNLAFPEFLVIKRVEQYVGENFPDGLRRV